MFYRKIGLILTVMTIFLFSLSSMAQADPPVTDDEAEPVTGSSLGENLDLNNLGTIMSARNYSSDDSATGNDPVDSDGDPGDDNGDDNEQDAGDIPDDGAEESVKEHPVASAMAQYFADKWDLSYEELYDQIMESHLAGNGFGAIARAYFFADKLATPLTPQELLDAAHESGWGNVLKVGGIHPGSVGNGGAQSNQADHISQDGPPGQLKKNDVADPVGSNTMVGPGGGNNQNGQGNQGNGHGNGHDKNEDDNGNNGRGHRGK